MEKYDPWHAGEHQNTVPPVPAVGRKRRCRNAGKGRKADPGTAESGDDAEGGAGKVRSRARRHSQNRGRERSSTG